MGVSQIPMTFQESPATLPHRINSNRNTKYWRTSWFVHESWNVMNYCRKEKGILLFSPPKQRRQVNLFSKTNNWLAEVRFPILSPDRKMTITQMLVAYGFTQIERVWRKSLPSLGWKLLDMLENPLFVVGLRKSRLLGTKVHMVKEPKHCSSIRPGPPTRIQDFWRKTLSFSRDMLVSGRVMHQKRRLLQDLFVVRLDWTKKIL